MALVTRARHPNRSEPQDVASLLETAAEMADALSSLDASTAKKARGKSVVVVETVDVSLRPQAALERGCQPL